MKKTSTPPADLAGLSPGLRRYLYITAACTGGAIMIVEILGAKMLAPFIGTSHFVWTAQIAITLVALATGYYLGGRLVDRSTKLSRLYGCIAAAGIYLAITISVVEPVAFFCLKFKLALGSLLASAFLFFIPLGLLAMVGPFIIRVITSSIHGMGGNVGRLTAVSTLGSFAGTLLIGYVLIPFLPNSFTMYLISALLLMLTAGYFLGWARKRAPHSAGAALAGLALGFFGVQQDLRADFDNYEELLRENSDFGMLQVLQSKHGPQRLYLNDYLTQNTYDILEKKSSSMFTYMLHDLAVAYTTAIDSVLCIGMGVGIVPMDFARAGADVTVAEINPQVVPLAEEHFGFEPGLVDLYIGDGRHLVAESEGAYDAVILDAFLGDSSPSHLMTREAFAAMRDIMDPKGVLVINCFGDFDPGRDFLVASLHKTLSSVFASVVIHNEYNGGNVFFVASPSPGLVMHRQPGLDHVHPNLRQSVRNAFLRKVETNPNHGMVLTDDYNPVDFFDAHVREEIRKRLALGAQRL